MYALAPTRTLVLMCILALHPIPWQVRLRDTLQGKLGFRSAPPFPTFLPGDPGWESEDELLSPEAAEVPAAPADTKKRR